MTLQAAVTMIGVLVAGGALACDHSVGIANLGKGVLDGGTAINLYATKNSGIELVQSYVLPQNDFTGMRAEPLIAVLNPGHTFVYAAYTGPGQPIIVGLKVTDTGLVYEWQHELQTGDGGLQFTTLTAGSDFVIENTYPDPFGDLIVNVLEQDGTQLVRDATPLSHNPYAVLSGYTDRSNSLYYSCRSANGAFPATSVAVYKLKEGVVIEADSATPVAKSKNTTYLQGVCNDG